jgi:hypothetical protein
MHLRYSSAAASPSKNAIVPSNLRSEQRSISETMKSPALSISGNGTEAGLVVCQSATVRSIRSARSKCKESVGRNILRIYRCAERWLPIGESTCQGWANQKTQSTCRWLSQRSEGHHPVSCRSPAVRNRQHALSHRCRRRESRRDLSASKGARGRPDSGPVCRERDFDVLRSRLRLYLIELIPRSTPQIVTHQYSTTWSPWTIKNRNLSATSGKPLSPRTRKPKVVSAWL